MHLHRVSKEALTWTSTWSLMHKIEVKMTFFCLNAHLLNDANSCKIRRPTSYGILSRGSYKHVMTTSTNKISRSQLMVVLLGKLELEAQITSIYFLLFHAIFFPQLDWYTKNQTVSKIIIIKKTTQTKVHKTTQKTKNWVTRIPLNIGVNSWTRLGKLLARKLKGRTDNMPPLNF